MLPVNNLVLHVNSLVLHVHNHVLHVNSLVLHVNNLVLHVNNLVLRVNNLVLRVESLVLHVEDLNQEESVDAASVNIRPRRENTREKMERRVVDMGGINAEIKEATEEKGESVRAAEAKMLTVFLVSRQNAGSFRLL